jgi:hypothetical protein
MPVVRSSLQVKAFERTCLACPSELSVETGNYIEELSDGLDGFMTVEELKARLCGVLEFPPAPAGHPPEDATGLN